MARSWVRAVMAYVACAAIVMPCTTAACLATMMYLPVFQHRYPELGAPTPPELGVFVAAWEFVKNYWYGPAGILILVLALFEVLYRADRKPRVRAVLLWLLTLGVVVFTVAYLYVLAKTGASAAYTLPR